ncbi:HAD-IA family hydrolase [Methylonatrum kenyense]|uniref:HAD family hydrolase n=1 Tax=Methylonatrum kenyense TaxID=455253 RepID=UPI0020C0E7B5|nr:HAD-IA family hydrolase [Methylonatrum kenyense]MCK8515961.1 HAD-IA family hydrolase [Methylonatrum kenyense]
MHREGKPVRAVLLDLDGTLLDTAPDLIACANQLLREQGLAEKRPGSYGHSPSLGSAGLLQRAFHLPPGHPDMAPLHARFLRLYRQQISDRTRPFPGMLGVLDTLEARGIAWAVATNKPKDLSEPVLAAFDLLERADALLCGDQVQRPKPHPEMLLELCAMLGVTPAEAVMVGDAKRDITAGHAAGMRTLGCLFGYLCAEDRPTRWGADGLLQEPLDLLRWLEHVERREAA